MSCSKAQKDPCHPPHEPCPPLGCHHHQPPIPEGCSCILAASKSAASSANSALAAAKSAELAQNLLKNCLSDSTIEEGGGLLPSEGEEPDRKGIRIDETWLDERTLQADELKEGDGIDITPGNGEVTIASSIVQNGGLAFKDGKLYVDFSKVPAVDLKKLLDSIVQEGGGLSTDENGKLYVDFGKMPTDKFQALLKQIRVPVWLTKNTDFYVNGDTGSDTLDDNRGTKEKPFRTVQACVNYVTDNYNLNRYVAFINIAVGTYSEAVTVGSFNVTTGYLALKRQGDSGTVLIRQTKTGAYNRATFTKTGSGSVRLYNLNIEIESSHDLADASLSRDAYAVNIEGGTVTLYNCHCIYRATKGGQRKAAILVASGSGYLGLNKGNIITSVFTTGKKPIGFYASCGGWINLDNVYDNPTENKCTVAGHYATVAVIDSGTFNRNGTMNMPLVAEGTVFGKRYSVINGSRCTVGGGTEFFPGDSAGSVDLGTGSYYK